MDPVVPMRAARPQLVTMGVLAVVAASSHWLPEDYSATAVGCCFLLATYWLAVDAASTQSIRRYGLSLGGLVEPEPIDWRRLVRDAAIAVGWAAVTAALIFPFFWAGFVFWWSPAQPFNFFVPRGLLSEVLGQIVVVALPEEAFFRGYLMTALDDRTRWRVRVLGQNVGLGLVVSSAWFALGHVLTEPYPSRLAVFFPALVFGWLRSRTGGIGASLCFHAMSNLFASFLGRGYGLWGS